MKIAPHWKYRLASLFIFIGLVMVLFTVDPLIDYHEKTSTYLEKMEPLLDRLEQYSSSFQNDPKVAASEFNKISNEIDQARFFNKPNLETLRVPKYPHAQFFIGFSCLMLGLYSAEKHKPKAKEKSPDPEPTNPWDSVPAPELKQSPAINDQD